MRLVNFAYGELITAGGYTLAYLERPARDRRDPRLLRRRRRAGARPGAHRFRPLRGAAPATMLVATFASASCCRTSSCSRSARAAKSVGTLGGLNTAVAIGSLRIRWISIVAVVVGGVLLAGTALLLNRTTIGLQIRAAAADFRTARILGVRANRVIAFSFLDLGLPRRRGRRAAHRAVAARHARLRRAGDDLRARRRRRRRPRPAARRRRSAASRSASRPRSSAPGCPSSSSVYLPSVIYGLVILVLLMRPGGLCSPARGRPRGARVRRRLDPLVSLLAPAALVIARRAWSARRWGSRASSSSTTRSSTPRSSSRSTSSSATRA